MGPAVRQLLLQPIDPWMHNVTHTDSVGPALPAFKLPTRPTSRFSSIHFVCCRRLSTAQLSPNDPVQPSPAAATLLLVLRLWNVYD